MKSCARPVRFLITCSVAIAAVAGAAGGSLQAGQGKGAERTLEESLYDMSDSAFVFACSADGEPLPEDEGELVDLHGQIYERFSLIRDATGEYHYSLSTMPVGLEGVGATSGEEFRVSENSRTIANQRLAGGTGSYKQELRMVGRDTHRSFWLVTKGNYTIAADGEFIVTRQVHQVHCRV